MQQITETEFNAIVKQTEAENAERVSMGLEPHVLSTNAYGAVSGSGSLVEYTFANSMFGYVQDGVHYSNGI